MNHPRIIHICNVKEVSPSTRLIYKSLIYLFFYFVSWFHNNHCWKLHLEMRPKKLKKKEKEKTTATITHDLGSDSREETNITAMGLKGKEI